MNLSSGHTADMINRLKDNRDKSSARRSKIATLRANYADAVSTIRPMTQKNISKEELTKIKDEIRRSIKKQNRRKVWAGSIILIVLICLTVAIVTFLIN